MFGTGNTLSIKSELRNIVLELVSRLPADHIFDLNLDAVISYLQCEFNHLDYDGVSPKVDRELPVILKGLKASGIIEYQPYSSYGVLYRYKIKRCPDVN